MKRRSFFKTLIGFIAAPLVVKALPVADKYPFILSIEEMNAVWLDAAQRMEIAYMNRPRQALKGWAVITDPSSPRYKFDGRKLKLWRERTV